MTHYKSSDIGYLLLGPVNLVSVTDKLELGIDSPLKDTTPFGVDAAQFDQPGLKTYSLTGHDGWYDDALFTTASQMVAMAAGQSVFMFAHKGNTAGLEAVCAGGVLNAGLKNPMAVGDFHRAAMELGVSGVIDNATIVAPLTSRAGDVTTEATYVDLGVAGGGTTGGNAYMACTALALTGSTNLIVSIEDSANHIAWAEHTAFAAITAVGAQKVIATDMTVNRYLAYSQVFTGLAGTPTATVTAAFKVNAPH